MKKSFPRPALWPAAALLLAALFISCQSLPRQTASDLSRLQGHWQGLGPGGKCSVNISGNSLHFQARPDFWYQTEFILLADTTPKQLHATIIKDSSPEQAHIGTVVVAIFKIEGETLTLGVVEDFEKPPTEPIASDFESTFDHYYLKRAEPQGNAAESRTPQQSSRDATHNL